MKNGRAYQAQGVVDPHHHAKCLPPGESHLAGDHLLHLVFIQQFYSPDLVGAFCLGLVKTRLEEEIDFVFCEAGPPVFCQRAVLLPSRHLSQKWP